MRLDTLLVRKCHGLDFVQATTSFANALGLATQWTALDSGEISEALHKRIRNWGSQQSFDIASLVQPAGSFNKCSKSQDTRDI